MQTIAQVDEAIDSAVNYIILTQLGMKAGIKTFGHAGVESIYKEMKQFHDREVVKPLRPCDVTYDIKRRALGYLVFLNLLIILLFYSYYKSSHNLSLCIYACSKKTI